MKKVKDLPENQRPREKIVISGPQSLSDIELLAVLLRIGSKKRNVMSIARCILNKIDNNGGVPNLKKLQKIDGVGLAKATTIIAALEFSRRRIKPEGTTVHYSLDVLPLIRHYADRKQEHLICISLNGAKEVIAIRVVTIGLVNSTQIHPREVYADPITDRAASIILAHNHPSGNIMPGKEDIMVTRRINKSGELLGIKLLDHIIFNTKDYYSFLEEGRLKKSIHHRI